MAKTLLQVIVEDIEEDIRATEDSITRGVPDTFDEYRRLCGVKLGLERAKAYIKNREREQIGHDDDE